MSSSDEKKTELKNISCKCTDGGECALFLKCHRSQSTNQLQLLPDDHFLVLKEKKTQIFIIRCTVSSGVIIQF